MMAVEMVGEWGKRWGGERCVFQNEKQRTEQPAQRKRQGERRRRGGERRRRLEAGANGNCCSCLLAVAMAAWTSTVTCATAAASDGSGGAERGSGGAVACQRQCATSVGFVFEMRGREAERTPRRGKSDYVSFFVMPPVFLDWLARLVWFFVANNNGRLRLRGARVLAIDFPFSVRDISKTQLSARLRCRWVGLSDVGHSLSFFKGWVCWKQRKWKVG
jgi:hypothetical protein